MSGSRLVWLFSLPTLVTAPRIAHETGIIRLASNEVSVGGELGLRGEKLPKSTTLRLELRGSLETVALGAVRTNAAGRFEARLPLPAEARAGSYAVVVLASDGDVAARAALVIIAAASTQMMDRGQRKESSHPTAEMMNLTAATTGGERAAILMIVLASLGGGLLLLRGSSRGRPQTNL
jgi:hypothetical protein